MIIEDGTLETLLNTDNSAFRKLWDMQKNGMIDVPDGEYVEMDRIK